ncbi:MAG: aminotransferase class V-fold PLP-dependent enzyme [Propionibacteriales bacterium]|nr:aminotransferase class V-fold PLP-dependent enzyme [Propionibacteriales bacterium]
MDEPVGVASVVGVEETVYLDAATTEPLHPAAKEVLLAAYDDGWADPRALHQPGRRAALLFDNAREVVAHLLGARHDEVTFTPSGTAAIQAGLAGAAAARERVGRVVVHSAVEHSAVLHTAAWLAGRGGEVRSVPVNATGRVDPEKFAAEATGPEVAVACLQQANHEVGTIQPVEDVAAICHDAGVPLLVDAAAAAGRVEPTRGWSVLAASARKWGGPSGIGVLAVRKGVRWRQPWPDDERGYVNVPGALAAAAALQAVVAERAETTRRQSELVDRIRTEVAATIPDVEVVGDPDRRLPHLVTFSCLNVDGEALVTELARRGFGVASGSACTASTLEPSHVLAAMGALTHGNVRVSLTRDTTEDEVERFVAQLPEVVTQQRARVGL